LYDPIGGQPIAISRLQGLEAREYVFLQPELARAWDKVRRPFKNRHLSLQSWTRDFGKLVVRVEGEEDAGTYYLVDLKTNKADLLADAWPDVPPEAIATVRTLTYKAADGLAIPAYLTTPAGRDTRKLPLIVLPHGGPEARDEPGFDWWAQALASRGYAVLQPQFRGSDGFGRKFVEAGYGQWGRKMQTDLSDGVRHLASQGVIDPKRVCIMGASYGGYAALAGATLDPGVYRCAVSVNGVSDLPMMLAAEARVAGGSDRANIRYWSRFMGASFRQRGELDAVSPARQAAKADGPILLIHGKDDTVVPYQQSAEMHRALERAGKPVQLVTLPAEDHWLSRGTTRLQMLKSAVAFLETHNPPN
jgi:dipeptidyl aminopeptidase/acylaminoacyl peptidase